jgi:uncharacterized membrane protein YfcA
MPTLDPGVWVLIGFAAVLAGFIDSAVGGGGMVLVPTLFTALPNVAPATILGTNKISGIGGTGMASLQFARKINIQWRLVLPSALAALLAAMCGAYLVSYVPVSTFKKVLPPLLVLLLAYTLFSKQLGQTKPFDSKQSIVWGVLFGAACGLYDGVFGPGTGSFLVLLWVRVYGFDFLNGSAHAKLVNLGCNAGALLWFLPNVPVFIGMGLMMMVCNILGAWAGAKTTLKYGNGFVRKLLILVVIALICRTSYDAYFK